MSLNLLSNGKSSPQLWLTKIEGCSSLLNTDCLDDSSLQRYERLSSSKKRQQFLSSRWLIKQAVHHIFDIPISDISITENTNRPPDIHPLPPSVFYSLSHSHDWVALLFSVSPCGVDIEKKTPRKNMIEMAKSFMSAQEHSYFCKSHSQDYFYRCWCTKEAFYKSLTRSVQITTQFHTIETDKLFQSSISTLLELSSATYQLTIFNSSADCTTQAYLVGDSLSNLPPFTSLESTEINWTFIPPDSLSCK